MMYRSLELLVKIHAYLTSTIDTVQEYLCQHCVSIYHLCRRVVVLIDVSANQKTISTCFIRIHGRPLDVYS